MAVYGIGENKCLKEVVSKNDFVVIDRTVKNLQANVEGSFTVTAKELGIDSFANYVLISHMVRGNATLRYPYTHGAGRLADHNFVTVAKDDSAIRVNYMRYKTDGNLNIKIVFMKVN